MLNFSVNVITVSCHSDDYDDIVNQMRLMCFSSRFEFQLSEEMFYMLCQPHAGFTASPLTSP